MKKSIYSLLFLGFIISETYSQAIRIKRQFFVPYPQYFAGEQYIGNSTNALVNFMELHSQDSVLIQQHMTAKDYQTLILKSIFIVLWQRE